MNTLPHGLPVIDILPQVQNNVMSLMNEPNLRMIRKQPWYHVQIGHLSASLDIIMLHSEGYVRNPAFPSGQTVYSKASYRDHLQP